MGYSCPSNIRPPGKYRGVVYTLSTVPTLSMVDARRADLHLHSTASDGALPPAEVVARAYAAGLRAVALTDHDTVAGVAEAQSAAEAHGMRCLTGVEISASVEGEEVHLLGYGFDPEHQALQNHFTRLQSERRDRARAIVQKLQGLGVEISYEAVANVAGEGAIGRPHVAGVLVAQGQVASFHEAFDRYLGNDAPAYVAKPPFPADEALTALHEAGGVGVLAHPGHWTASHTLRHLVNAGLDGLEVIHPSHDDTLRTYYQGFARGQNLLMTGGSDFHSDRSGGRSRLGRYTIPYAYVDRLLQRVDAPTS